MTRKQSVTVWLVLAAVGLIAALLAFGQLMPAARAQEETPTTVSVTETRTKITSPALEGNLFGDPAERTVLVLLPPGYETGDRRYPVLYVTPGGDFTPDDHAWRFKRAMESGLRDGEIREMIVVVPDGANTLGGSHFMSSPTIGDYEAYVTRDVVDYVDTHYRTLPGRDSRGISGCSNGGSPSMRLAFKYPNVFSVVAATDGNWDWSLDVWPSDVEAVQRLTQLPGDIGDLVFDGLTGWYVQLAAVAAPDPDNPPFYCEMPFRIVDGHGEFVPDVIDKIVDRDAAHEARRYVQQPVRLRGIRLQRGIHDFGYEQPVQRFEQLLIDLGIEHEYVEVRASHCGGAWEAASLKYMSEHLVFEEQ